MNFRHSQFCFRANQLPNPLCEFIAKVIPLCCSEAKKEKQLARDGEQVFSTYLD
jgi:hypothetical protein